MGKKVKWVIGIDEVGRGPLAGPVTVAAVAAPLYLVSGISYLECLHGIRDSKKLSKLQREKWVPVVRNNFMVAVSSVSPAVIDRKGITWAARAAVTRCLHKLHTRYNIRDTKYEILLDGGLCAPVEYKRQKSIIKGDERVPIIAAASIVAKVHRDRYMTRLHKKYPQYRFDRHKGYGTVMHREAIQKHGISVVHRKTFCRNIVCL